MDELVVKNESESEKAIAQLKDVVAKKHNQADAFVEKLTDAICVALKNETIADENATHFVANMSEDLIKKIKSGEIKLDAADGENFYAQIRNANGQYGSKISIHEELMHQGISPAEAKMAMDMAEIEDTLDAMMDVLSGISADVTSVLQGQKNDRIGLYYSGQSLYLESKSVQNANFRYLIVSQALKSISDALSQIMQSFQDDILYLKEEKYNGPRKKRIEDIGKKMFDLNSCYEVLHCSYITKATIYFECGETEAALAVFDEYGQFLKEWVVPNRWTLSELESDQNLIAGEIWINRANQLTAVESVRQQIENKQSSYRLSAEVQNG